MTDCPIPGARGTQSPTGLGTSGVLLLGEAMGDLEREESRGFVERAPAGSVLERAIRRSGFRREQFIIWNVCFPGDTLVQSPGNVDVTKRLYDGPVVTLHTSRGVLTGTPNHPALTTRGWVALGGLQDGDDLVCGPLPEWVGGCNPYVYNSPTRIEDVFNTATVAGIRHRIIGSNMDFHGDGMNREVDIIRANRFLWSRNYASLFKHLKERLLEHSPTLTSYRAFQVLCATLPQRLRPLFVSLGETDGSLLPGSDRSWIPYEPVPVSLRNRLQRDFIECKNLAKGLDVHTERGRETLKRVSESVPLAKVSKVEWSKFSGHVYNLHTTTGHYTANGFVVSNCPTQPPNNYLEGAPYEADAIAWGLPQTKEVVDRYAIRCIVALGNVAFRALTGLSGIMESRGYPVPSCFGIPVIGTLHPSFLRRGAMAYLGVLMHDIKFAVALASRSDGPVEFWSPVLWRQVLYIRPSLRPLNEPLVPPGYVCYPSESAALDFLREVEADSTRLLAYDIETSWSPQSSEEQSDDDDRNAVDGDEIVSIQFSMAPGHGIFMPWRDPFVGIAKACLGSPNPKLGANNWRFDDLRLRNAGVQIAGVRHDIRWAWSHFQPDLSAGLQFVTSFYAPELAPWKHLHASHKEVYGIRDVDALMRIV